MKTKFKYIKYYMDEYYMDEYYMDEYYLDEYYLEVEKIFNKLINEDISYLIIKELKFLNNSVTCMKCKKKKHKKYMSDNEYMCSKLCGFCGICIYSSNICLKCIK